MIWDQRLNMRKWCFLFIDRLFMLFTTPAGITVARIYCTHETREAFELLWTKFWDTVEQVTGRPVQFKFMDGKGLLAILVNGCKAQADGCGDALLKQNAKRKNTRITETDPRIIVQYILRTCDIHLDRYFQSSIQLVPTHV